MLGINVLSLGVKNRVLGPKYWSLIIVFQKDDYAWCFLDSFAIVIQVDVERFYIFGSLQDLVECMLLINVEEAKIVAKKL